MKSSAQPTITSLPLRDDLTAFLEKLSIVPNEYTDKLAVRASACRYIDKEIHSLIVELSKTKPESPAGAVENILMRGVEMCLGAMVAESSGLFAQSEVLSRSALEYAARVRYILAGDAQDRYQAYMHAFPGYIDDGLRKWEQEAQNLPEPHKSTALAAVTRERNSNRERQSLLKKMVPTPNEPFPKTTFAVFSGAEMQLAYRTLYWRLSSQAHGDAEDTINYFGMLMFKQSGNEDGFELVGKEAVIFSVWYAHMVLEEVLTAARLFCEKFEGKVNQILLELHACVHADTEILTNWMSAPTLDMPDWGKWGSE